MTARPAGWAAPGCAGGTWLTTDPLAPIVATLVPDPTLYAALMAERDARLALDAAQRGYVTAYAQWATDTLTDQAQALGLLPAGATLEYLES